ncbi:MAG: hypothetical protein IIB21_01730 [Chloroflexi bacterium]|nr:hypothetical protein [Chloroflexota bacterium]
MTNEQKAISPSWTWALAAIALTAFLVASLVSMASGPASAADPGTCDPARPHAAGSFDETITSGGVTREYILYVPPSYTGAETVPVVLNWHGLGSNASDQQDYSELPAKADEAGFIVAAPQGLGDPASHNFTTIVPEPDSVLFTNDLLDELESQLCIDTARVFSTGFSNGAQMSTRLACNASERIAAIAPVAGWYFPPAIVQLSAEPPCSSTRPVPIIAFHGAADPLIPFDGGPGTLDLVFRDIDDEVLPEWAEHNGCAGVPTEEQAAPGVRLVRYADCDQGATVELYVIEDADGAGPGTEGGGHTWPGSTFVLPPETKARIGLTTHEISATDLMWEFFQAHALPASQEPAPTPTASVPQPTATALSVALPATGAGGSSGGANSAGWVIVATAAAVMVALGGAAWYATRRHG